MTNTASRKLCLKAGRRRQDGLLKLEKKNCLVSKNFTTIRHFIY